MNLEANASSKGYAMAALLVAMSVMAVLLTVALPTWNQTIRREKEEELIFRGNQYARAINLYQRKFANASPTTLDVLIEQHLLRKKFRDPMSNEKEAPFQMLYVNTSAQPGRQGGGGQAGAGQTGAGQGGAGQPSAGTALSTTNSGGGIMGVASKNTGESIRTFNGRNHYNEWQFIAMQQSTQGGGGQPQQGGGRQGSVRPDESFVGRDGSGRAVDTRGRNPGEQQGQPQGGRGMPPPQPQGGRGR